MSKYDPNQIERFSTVFNALSNPHRLQIFTMLSGCCSPRSPCSTDTAMACCVGDLGNELDIAASTLSHHLKELSHAGLINMQRDGKQVICSVNNHTLNELRHYFQNKPEVDHEPETGR